MLDLDGHSSKVVGTKQVIRALREELVDKVYLASDADESVKLSVVEMCSDMDITTIEVLTMRELGDAFGIKVGAATAAVLKQA